MAELARMTRPWLFSLARPAHTPSAVLSSYLGLGYRNGFSTTAVSHAKRPSGQSAAMRRERSKAMELEAASSLLLPHTLVPPPLHRFPFQPQKLAHMIWLIVKNRIVNLGGCLSIYFLSMPRGRIGWPRFRMNRNACIPAAKSLHVTMSEAVAAGDKDTLRRICTPELFRTLAGAVDSRPRGIRTEWELLGYEQRMRYPRLADFRIAALPPSRGQSGTRLVKQAVVSIASVQRLSRYDAASGGVPIPGSQRERHMVEHIVLQTEINGQTFESEPWKIWGSLSEMPYERIRDDTLMYNHMYAMGQQRAK
ncbi:hypothetical protein GGR50DRAFT_599220 [Xylaria sp. CBS 124048]|nr:hypothetical protein GGR50DRAFT_599220 [Xylaria sp. CBS 124048]